MLDTPSLHQGIPRTVTLSLGTNPYAVINDAQIHLAIEAVTRGVAKIHSKQTLVQNVQCAASQALASALNLGGAALDCRWWPNAAAAENGREPRESGEMACLQYAGPQSVIIEFNGEQKHQKLKFAQDASSSEVLTSFESACPGFTHMLYSVLDLVNGHVWPIITPRTLWDAFVYDSNASGQSLCDADFALGQLLEFIEPEALAEKYGITDLGAVPANEIITLFEEEIGGVLPSFFVQHFGKAAIGGWPLYIASAVHQSIPDPATHVREDIAVAMVNMELRDWCPMAPQIIHALERMAHIASSIADGATLASGTWLNTNPSTSAIHLRRFAPVNSGKQRRANTEGNAFNRVLDDVARGAWESGEVVECAGWFSADAGTQAQAQEALQLLQQGAHTLEIALDLILQLFTTTDPLT